MKKLSILATLITLAGCGGGSLTGSSSSKLPSVAGIYRGALHFDVDNSRLGDGSATFTVTQSNASVTITGTITVETDSVELSPVQCRIDATGLLVCLRGNSATFTDPDCGTVTATAPSGAFHERALDYSQSATTSFCGNLHIYGTLTR